MPERSNSMTPKGSSRPTSRTDASEKDPDDLEAGVSQSSNTEIGEGEQPANDQNNIDPSAPTSKNEGTSINTEEADLEVWWDEPADQDPANPISWSSSRKWLILAVLSFICFLTPLASSMFAPGVPQVLVDFNTSSSILATFVVSVFVLGFACGPLFLAPLSEMYGRLPIYHTCNVLFLIFTILCAVATNMGMLITFRFFAGVAGVATVTCGSGTIADIMPVEKRARAISLWSLGPILGPIIGPVIGGPLSQARSWRWTFWVIAIGAGLVTIVSYFVLEETFPIVLLERKAARLREETGNPGYRSRLALNLTPRKRITYNIVRPMKMLFRSPIVAAMAIYVAVMYGLLYILFTTFTFVFQEYYHFSTSTAGLAFLGSGIGTILGLGYSGLVSDREVNRKMKTGEPLTPEDRLPTIITIPACLCLPSGLFIYAWSTDKQIHWIVPQIGTGMVGFGMISVLMSIMTYLVDTFPLHAASAIAANAVLRSLLGGLLPLCGLKMYDKLGLGWGNSLLAFLALALSPVPWLFGTYGERIRLNPRWQVKF